jgi:hypothetical protein
MFVIQFGDTKVQISVHWLKHRKKWYLQWTTVTVSLRCHPWLRRPNHGDPPLPQPPDLDCPHCAHLQAMEPLAPPPQATACLVAYPCSPTAHLHAGVTAQGQRGRGVISHP